MGNVTTQRCSMRKKNDPEINQNCLAPFGPWSLLKSHPLQDRYQGDQPHNITDLPHPEGRRRPEADLVKRCRRKLIGGIRWVDTILDVLFKDRILSTANVEAISIYAVQREKKRVLVDLVLRKGNEAQEALYKTLVRLDPVLLQELDLQPIRKQNVSDRLVSMDLLDFLDPDELKCFQWLISGHMTEELSSPGGVKDSKQKENLTKVLSKIVPTLSIGLENKESVMLESWTDVTTEMNMDLEVVQFIPDVSEDGTMFRFQCKELGVFHCCLTGLELEGVGELLYQIVPWNLDFLSSKGLRPAGPLFRFTLLNGRFHRLHLPHCQLPSEAHQHFLSVVHATEERVDFLTPDHVSESDVVIDVSGFSCFGLVTGRKSTAIRSLVVIFSQPSQRSLFVLMLPRNICLTQVIKQWKQRIGAEYLETIPDCELIPNQRYKLSGQPVTLIQPETSEFVNFCDYNNFLPSFQVQLPHEVTHVELQLTSHMTPLPLIGCLFSFTASVVWQRVVQLKDQTAACSAGYIEESVHTTLVLLQVLESLGAEDFVLFQYFLKLQPDPIPASRLENASRTRTVDLMVQHYHPEGARRVTEEILRINGFQLLADQL